MSWVSWMFLVNGAIESTAGLVAFIKPSALPTFAKVTKWDKKSINHMFICTNRYAMDNRQWQFGGGQPR